MRVRPLRWYPSGGCVVALAVIVMAALWMPMNARAAEGSDAADAKAAPDAAADSAEKKDEAPADTSTGKKPWIRGTFEAGFDSIWADGESDLNMDQYLRVQVDPPQCEKLHLRASIWMREDLDGDEPGYSALRDINDAYGQDVRIRPLYLYAQLDDLWGQSTLRVGRQRIVEGAAYNRIDGIYFKQEHARWDWYVFGGARASIYTDASDNLVLGGGVSVRPFAKTRVALDVYYGEEDRGHEVDTEASYLAQVMGLDTLFRRDGDQHDTSLALSVWQNVTPNLTLYGRLDWHDGKGDELTLNATGNIACLDLIYEVMYRRRLNSFGDRVNDLTGFYSILGPREENDTYLLALHKPIVKKIMLSLETEIHEAHGHDWSSANRDYERYAAILSADRIVWDTDASVSLERWSVEGGEGTWAVTGEVTKHWRKVALTVGADYQRYQDRVVLYDPSARERNQTWIDLLPNAYQGYQSPMYVFDTYRVELHENIHSVFVKTKWNITKNQDLVARVAYEEDNEPESPYWRAKLAYTIRF